MRVTQNEIYRTFVSDIERFNDNLNTISQQVSSGKKLTALTDSPAGVAKLVSLTDQKAEIDQYNFNTDAETLTFQTADSTLNEMNNLLTSIYTNGSEAASGATTQATRTTIANQIDALNQQILSLQQTQANGRNIFSDDPSKVTVADNVEVDLNVHASDAFNQISDAVNSLLNALQTSTGDPTADSQNIRSALGKFSAALSSLGLVRGKVGANLSLLQNIKSDLQSGATDLQKQQSDVQDADMAQAVVQLQQTQTALNAGLTAGGALFSQRNLFDILG